MKSLLLEIGAEEIPAGYIEPALNALRTTLLQKLTEARIDCGEAKIYGTPRRLAVKIKDVAEKQKTLTSEVLGPPEKVGLDQKGQPTVAAKKFAEKVGVSVGVLKVKDTEKGRYLCAKVTEKGLATRTILQGVLPEVILATPFPKTMKWAELDIMFARPIHSIVALWGNQVIPFTVGAVKSGRHTTGHFFMHSGQIKIISADDYVETLRSVDVYVDLEERKKIVEREIEKVAKTLGGKIFPDKELVHINKNLVEYPIATAGMFDKEFLEIPGEILISSMRKHQKYFAVIDKDEKLMPNFIAVNNTRTKDLKLVATGHERVLRARLADGQFFFKSDLMESMENWVKGLKGVLFQAKLGTMHEKVQRIQKMAEFLADETGQKADMKKKVSRAAWLCKADLESQVVYEFPDLQGIMGRVYATHAKEPEDVAIAIEEHYRPTYSGGPLPEHVAGALLSIADKIDSICGFFSVGLVPTGASDPYALRRQGIGIIQIIVKNGFSFSLRKLIEKSLKIYGISGAKKVGEITDQVHSFLQSRMTHILTEEGYSKDVVAAVAGVPLASVPDIWNRVRALQNLKTAPDFEPLAVAFKRVVNIIKKADLPARRSDVNESLFEDKTESALYTVFKDVQNKVAKHLDKGELDQALRTIASLRDPVDAFFDGVMVMAKNKKVRNNRLALLRQISDLFDRFADFSKIST